MNRGQTRFEPYSLSNSKLTYWSMGLAYIQTALRVV
jgi:hypothetical protein